VEQRLKQPVIGHADGVEVVDLTHVGLVVTGRSAQDAQVLLVRGQFSHALHLVLVVIVLVEVLDYRFLAVEV